MTDDDFKAELERFAGFVVAKKAQGILVDVARFHHKMGLGVQEWRVKNISTRYSAAGVRRFALLLPGDAPRSADDEPIRAGREFFDSRIQ